VCWNQDFLGGDRQNPKAVQPRRHHARRVSQSHHLLPYESMSLQEAAAIKTLTPNAVAFLYARARRVLARYLMCSEEKKAASARERASGTKY
jgi:hypothetical protein